MGGDANVSCRRKVVIDPSPEPRLPNEETALIDLSHTIKSGLTTYKGIPAPHICDYWTREQSEAFYDDGSSFHIGRIDMVANTGTYLDSPFHRWDDGVDIAGLPLERLAKIDALVVRPPYSDGLAVGVDHLRALNVRRRRGKTANFGAAIRW